jgi:hypothetical protein
MGRMVVAMEHAVEQLLLLLRRGDIEDKREANVGWRVAHRSPSRSRCGVIGGIGGRRKSVGVHDILAAGQTTRPEIF